MALEIVPVKEAENDSVELLGTFEARKVCRGGDRGTLCARNLRCELVRDLVDVAHVLVARHDDPVDEQLDRLRNRERHVHGSARSHRGSRPPLGGASRLDDAAAIRLLDLLVVEIAGFC